MQGRLEERQRHEGQANPERVHGEVLGQAGGHARNFAVRHVAKQALGAPAGGRCGGTSGAAGVGAGRGGGGKSAGRFGVVLFVEVRGKVAHPAHLGRHGLHIFEGNDLLGGREAGAKNFGDAALDVGHDVLVATEAGEVGFHFGQVAAEHFVAVFFDVEDEALQVDANVLFHAKEGRTRPVEVG